MKLVVIAAVLCFGLQVVYGENYYELLGVSRNAGKREIKSAYRALAKKWHPDKHPPETKAEAQAKYQEITHAYEVLTDAQKRRTYDQEGEEGLKKPQGGRRSGGGWGDIFNFGFGGGGNGRETIGESLKADLFVTLEDVYLGKEVTVTHKKQTLCPICRGTGAEDPDDVQTCDECGGSGVKTVVKRLGPGFMTQTQTTCNKCGGKGKIMKTKCPTCQGSKLGSGEETITIVIEKGMEAGAEIKFEQEADQNPGEIPGDLIFQLRLLPHNKFKRDGNDLRFKGSISLLEALVGFTKHVKHLDGHIITLERTAVTKPGFTMVLPGEGMPIHESDSFGDLYVEFSVRFPNSITKKQKEAFKEILGD